MEQRETRLVAKPFDEILKARGWVVENIHGNQYQMGLPDRYIHHPDYSPKWVEYKVIEDDGSIKLTRGQKIKFPVLLANNVPIFVVCHKDLRKNDREKIRLYKKLFEEPNAQFILNPKTVHLAI